MKISVVIATYNRAELLNKGLGSLVTQRFPTGMELVIVDDGSSDNTKDVVNSYISMGKNLYEIFAYHDPSVPYFTVKYIYLPHPEPRISCCARNVGIQQASGQIIIFTEPEALQVGDTIQQLLDEFDKHPNNTIVASQVWTTQEKIAATLTEDDYDHPEKILHHPYAQLTTSSNLENTNAPDSDWAITGEKNCNAGVLFLTRKDWLMEIQGFNEEFTGHGWDDFDLFNRLALIGHGVVKCPDIAVIHMYHKKDFYNYNIYEHAERNGKISEAMIKEKKYVANAGKDWGKIC